MTVTASIKSSGGDYVSLQAFEDAIPTDATEPYIGNVDEAFDADGVSINVANGHANQPTHIFRGGVGFRWTEAVAGGTTHGGVEGTKARIDNNLNTAVIIGTNNIEVSHLDIKGHGATTRDGVHTTTSSIVVTLHHLLIHDCGDEGLNCQRGVVTIYNCVIYDCADIGMTAVNSTSSITAYNNTVYSCAVGMNRTGGTFVAKNNACLDNSTADYQGTFDAASDNNLSSDTSAPGTTTHHSVSSATFFVDLTGGAEDFHNDAGVDGTYEGSDESGTFTDDADEDTRVDWDIGAYEIIGAPPASTTPPNSLMMMGAGV